MNEKLSATLAKFSNIGTRCEAAEELCLFFQAKKVLIFYFDDQAKTYLPAPGFRQTLSNAGNWQAFCKSAEDKDFFEGSVPLENGNENVTSFHAGNKCFMLLVNPTINSEYTIQLQQLFSLIASIILLETQALDLQARMKNAESTARKAEKLTVSLDNVTNKLQQALSTEEEFLSVASHELKTPVTSIKAFVHILLELYPEQKDLKLHNILGRIKFQVDRIIEIITDLLDTSKIELGGLQLNMEKTCLDPIVTQVIDDHRAIYPGRQIQITGGTKKEIVCDQNRISQVVNNLLTNAIKYSDNSSPILVNIDEGPNNIQVDIRDFGIGISKENLPNLFSRFYRAHGKDFERLSSLGLGLYISENIIKRHKGKIWVESTLGEGSTFHFSLPLQ